MADVVNLNGENVSEHSR